MERCAVRFNIGKRGKKYNKIFSNAVSRQKCQVPTAMVGIVTNDIFHRFNDALTRIILRNLNVNFYPCVNTPNYRIATVATVEMRLDDNPSDVLSVLFYIVVDCVVLRIY